MEEVTHLLHFIQEDEGHSLRGGPPDALIAYATTVSASKIGNIFCEAFIHTYTTFISFENLLDKLSQRLVLGTNNKENTVEPDYSNTRSD